MIPIQVSTVAAVCDDGLKVMAGRVEERNPILASEALDLILVLERSFSRDASRR